MRSENRISDQAARSPRERLVKLAKLFPVQHAIPRSTTAVGLAILIALVIVVLSAVALGIPAVEIFQSYTQRIWDLIN